MRTVQKVLHELGLYAGSVDGLTGPQTRQAVENYRRIVGLEAGSQIDGSLLRQLGIDQSGQALEKPVAMPAPRPSTGEKISGSSSQQADPQVKRIQAGLRAFGHEGIEVDGVLGRSTREAIREFQSLFGLPVTGELDAPLLAKMQEVGLIN